MWAFLVQLWFLAPCIVVGFLYLLARNGYFKRASNLPPGPKGLPLIGFLPFLARRDPHLQLHKLRKQYGDVFGMYMGNKYFLILGDLESTKEAFNREEFTPRPDGCFQLGGECANFASTFGQHWVDHRKLATRCLRQQMLKSHVMEENFLDHISRALDRLDDDRRQNPTGQVHLRVSLTESVNNFNWGILSGRTFQLSEQVNRIISRFQQAFSDHATSISLDRSMPWLKPVLYFLLPHKKRILKAFQDMEAFCWSQIEAHEQDPTEECLDFLDFYLEERNKSGMSERLTRSDLNGDTQMLLFASGDTVRSTLEWFILCMGMYQNIQEKVYQEIYEVLGHSGTPKYADKHKLPYTEATILESMRYITLVPLTPIHSTLKDTVTSFRGYDIPGDSVVISNQWGILHDSKNWVHPDQFYPKHFLTADENRVVVPEAFIPFGIGKRICIGDKVALVEVFLFVVSFLQRFQVLPPEGGIKLNDVMKVTSEAEFPIVRLTPRDN